MNANPQYPGPVRPLNAAEASAEAARLIREAYAMEATAMPTSYRDTTPVPVIGAAAPVAQPDSRIVPQWAAGVAVASIGVGAADHRTRLRCLAHPPGTRVRHPVRRPRGHAAVRRGRRGAHRRRVRRRPGPVRERHHHEHLRGHRDQADRRHLNRPRHRRTLPDRELTPGRSRSGPCFPPRDRGRCHACSPPPIAAHPG